MRREGLRLRGSLPVRAVSRTSGRNLLQPSKRNALASCRAPIGGNNGTCRRASARSPRRKAGWGCTASLRTHPRRFRAHRDAPPHPCASRGAELGPALRRPAPLTCSSLPQSGQPKLCACETCRQRPQRSRDSRLGLDRLGRRTGRSPGQPATHIPADLNRYRKGAPSPPRSNGQVFDEASNPVTVAGRRCRASGRVRPCWDQAFPCCSPLTGRASGPLAASRPSRPVAALSYLTEGGRVPLGSVDWQ